MYSIKFALIAPQRGFRPRLTVWRASPYCSVAHSSIWNMSQFDRHSTHTHTVACHLCSSFLLLYIGCHMKLSVFADNSFWCVAAVCDCVGTHMCVHILGRLSVMYNCGEQVVWRKPSSTVVQLEPIDYAKRTYFFSFFLLLLLHSSGRFTCGLYAYWIPHSFIAVRFPLHT